MGKHEKLLERFLSNPKDFTWDELVKLLKGYGYEELTAGKTGGSRRKFADSDKNVISLHKPHPSKIVKAYALKDVKDHLKTTGKIK